MNGHGLKPFSTVLPSGERGTEKNGVGRTGHFDNFLNLAIGLFYSQLIQSDDHLADIG